MRLTMLFVPVLVVACSGSEPQKPTLTPERVSVTEISPTGIELLAEVAVDNPNAVDLEARSVSANVVLDGKHDLGTIEVPHKVELPSEQRTRLSVPLVMDWKDVVVVTALVALNKNVPFDVDGSVNVGGDVINVSLPFELSGTMTQEQLLQAVAKPPPPPMP